MRRLWPIHGVLPLVDARLGADDFMLPVESPKEDLGWVDLEYRNGNDLKTRTVKYGQTPSSYITKLTKDANGWAW